MRVLASLVVSPALAADSEADAMAAHDDWTRKKSMARILRELAMLGDVWTDRETQATQDEVIRVISKMGQSALLPSHV